MTDTTNPVDEAQAFIDRQIRLEIPVPLHRPDWLQARVPYFNASSAAVLFERHQFQTAAEYAVEKLTGDTSDDGQTSAMRRGQFLEDGVAEWWAHETGVQVQTVPVMYACGRILANVDRVDLTRERPVEIKTVSRHVDEPSQYWLDQCQAVMLCYGDGGADVMDLVWVDSSMTLQHQEVDADPVFQAELLRRAEKFMAAIDMGMVPDWITPTLSAAHVSALYPDPAGAVELGDDGGELIQRFTELKVKAKQIDAELDEIKDEITRRLGDHDTGLWDGVEVVTFKAPKAGSVIDAAALEADHPDIYRQYLKQKRAGRRFVPKL